MLIIIADSGSTKTQWAVWDGSLWFEFYTSGFNPYFQSEQEIIQQLSKEVLPQLNRVSMEKEVRLFYYGAGCSEPQQVQTMQSSCKQVLSISKVEVHHDLLGSARALCQHQSGIACILGTGSNSGYYNGSSIVENVPSVGYLWGDYGSGAHFGKTLIQDYFEKQLPKELQQAFEQEGYHREQILKQVYSTTMPSRYLAGFSKFIVKNLQHPYMQELVNRCFELFFKFQIAEYSRSKTETLHAVGSVAWYYKNQFVAVAQKNNYKVGQILQSPMSGLRQYHLSTIL